MSLCVVSSSLLLLFLSMCSAQSGVLHGPSLQTEDLRNIDSIVASGFPIFPKGFTVHGGNRPIIVKMKDPSGLREMPKVSYYRDLPQLVIPDGFEGIASSSFLLGTPIPPASFPNHVSPSYPVFQFRPANYNTFNRRSNFQPQQPPKNQAEFAAPSIRSENSLSPFNHFRSSDNEIEDHGLRTNPIVLETSNYESTLPAELRNPFYSNPYLAARLAQASLPIYGETVVDKWDTNKIQRGRVYDLLSGAGLI